MAGNLWTPINMKADDRLPAVLLVHGWGGEKNHLNRSYAPQFSEQGFIVLTFDYRGWGESDGKFVRVSDKPPAAEKDGRMTLEVREIRQIVNPLDQLLDVRNALAFLHGEANVDKQRIGIWGTSLGGGLALQTAGEFPAIKVLITQVGAVNSRQNFEGNRRGGPTFEQSSWQYQIARVRGDVPPFPAESAPGLQGAPDYHALEQYDPFAWADKIAAATLIIDADGEELFDTSVNGKALQQKLQHQVPVKYLTIPGKHYDAYRGKGYRQALQQEIDWLNEHLK
jgi:fermentation-respiration switch protein FrsA (DUF1100 family)